MSPCDLRAVVVYAGFPRVSGDEPQDPKNAMASMTFSPRERG